MTASRPTTLKQLRDGGWQSKPVKHELRDNFLAALRANETLFPGIVGYDDTVIPEISIAVLAGHDMLFLGEKGQAKSRLMRSLVRFLDEYVPYLDIPGSPVHEVMRPADQPDQRRARPAEQPDAPSVRNHNPDRSPGSQVLNPARGTPRNTARRLLQLPFDRGRAQEGHG